MNRSEVILVVLTTPGIEERMIGETYNFLKFTLRSVIVYARFLQLLSLFVPNGTL